MSIIVHTTKLFVHIYTAVKHLKRCLKKYLEELVVYLESIQTVSQTFFITDSTSATTSRGSCSSVESMEPLGGDQGGDTGGPKRGSHPESIQQQSLSDGNESTTGREILSASYDIIRIVIEKVVAG